MAADDELRDFIGKSLAGGQSRTAIQDVLRRAGWPQELIRDAVAGFADVDFPIPVPRPRPYLSAREAFLYLVLFSTLYVSAFNVGTLLFQFIDHAFPDPTAPYPVSGFREAVRWSVSALIVAFPVFLYVSSLTGRSVRADPSKRASKIRRWLTYLTLFVAAVILIGDFTTLVYSVLGGELTIRFVLKVLTVGAIAGAIYLYYLRDLRTEEKNTVAV